MNNRKITSFTNLIARQQAHHLPVARNTGYLSEEDLNRLAQQTVIVSRLITGLIKSIRSNDV